MWFPGGPAEVAAFSADGQYVIGGGISGIARCWNSANGRALSPEMRHAHKIASVSFSPDSRLALTTAGDNAARIWDVSSGRLLRSLQRGSLVNSAVFSPDGRRVLTARDD